MAFCLASSLGFAGASKPANPAVFLCFFDFGAESCDCSLDRFSEIVEFNPRIGGPDINSLVDGSRPLDVSRDGGLDDPVNMPDWARPRTSGAELYDEELGRWLKL